MGSVPCEEDEGSDVAMSVFLRLMCANQDFQMPIPATLCNRMEWR